MKRLRRRAIAKSIGAKFMKRDDHCETFIQCCSDGMEIHAPYYPRMCDKKFLEFVRKVQNNKFIL